LDLSMTRRRKVPLSIVIDILNSALARQANLLRNQH
jgi:hypothetical protein